MVISQKKLSLVQTTYSRVYSFDFCLWVERICKKSDYPLQEYKYTYHMKINTVNSCCINLGYGEINAYIELN